PIHPRCAPVTGHRGPGCLEYVEPVDPIIQGVESELRLPLRLQVELLSQREEFLGQAVPVDRKGLRQLLTVLRSRVLIAQAALHVSDSAFHRQGSFAPRPLRRFFATTTPSDFRTCDVSGYGFPVSPRGTTPARRISQVPRPLSRYAPPPTTPGSRTVALACVFTIRAGFTFSGRLAAPIVAFRGRIRFAFATARTVHLP